MRNESRLRIARNRYAFRNRFADTFVMRLSFDILDFALQRGSGR